MTIGVLVDIKGVAHEVAYTLDSLEVILGKDYKMAVIPKTAQHELSVACQKTGEVNTTASILFKASTIATQTEAFGKTLFMRERGYCMIDFRIDTFVDWTQKVIGNIRKTTGDISTSS